jgi:PucR family transcriptional regulator, purine catabolism regulatory protein
MGLTVAAALELEIFVRGEAKVLSGHDLLDRPVRWVHAGEIPDIARFLSGGEMLLTAGLGIGDTEARQRAYVSSVADAGAAVLVVELAGRAFIELPWAVIDEADRKGLPIVGLSNEIPFVEASAQVHGSIVDLRVKELTDDEAINEAFTQLLLNGDDYVSITAELARRVGSPVILEDSAHQIRAYSGRSAHADAVIADWDAHSRLFHQDGDVRALRTATTSDDVCNRNPVALRGELWGWIHVLPGERPLAPSEVYALERACAAVAITLLSERETGARRAQRHGALISRLMLGDISGEDFVRRALSLGRDIRVGSFVVVVAGSNGDGPASGEQALTESLAGAKATSVVADIGEQVLAVVALPVKGGERVVIEALQRAGIRAGISRIVEARQLLLAVDQARNAFAAANIGNSARIRRFDDLGVLRLLVLLAQGPELARYVEDELGQLLLHDAGSANKLLPTLQAYLDCDGTKAEAAAALHIQRRTLYYRLERLNTLLGMSLDDPDVRQRLLLALRGLELLNKSTVVA